MKKVVIVILALSGLVFLSSAFARDFSKYTTEELASMRGTLGDASSEEREAFRAEWQRRLENMTPEERQQYTGRPENAECQPPDAGTVQGRGKRKGGGGYGQGMGRGFGGGSRKGRGGGW